jgi:hypothetical protein
MDEGDRLSLGGCSNEKEQQKIADWIRSYLDIAQANHQRAINDRKLSPSQLQVDSRDLLSTRHFSANILAR